MSRKNCFVKVSGDMIGNAVLDWIQTLTRNYFVVVCVGKETHINRAFQEAGFQVKKHGPLGRETNSLEERQLARDVLEANQSDVQNGLDAIGARVCVVIPVIEIGTVLCHVNGDQMVLAAYHGFDVLYVVTTPERIAEKMKYFSPYPKVKVIGFET